MGRYHEIKCPICYVALQLEETDPIPERCPVCKEYIADKLHLVGDGTGLNTATANGPGMKPLIDLEEDVYG